MLGSTLSGDVGEPAPGLVGNEQLDAIADEAKQCLQHVMAALEGET